MKISNKTKKLTSMGMLTAMAATSMVPMGQAIVAYAEEDANLGQDTQSKENASVKPLKIAVASDLHLFPEDYVGNEGPNFQEYVNGDRKMLKESSRILNATVKRLIDSDADIVLIPGDLTKDSEVEAHELVAEAAKLIEASGKKVFVTNGNHDINAPGAEKFVAVSGEVGEEGREDKVEKLQGIMADEFEELYEEYGFNDGNTIANDPNSTSYVAELAPGYRLVVMDTGIYGANKEDQSTSGTLNKDGRLEWVLNQVKEAKDAGDTIIGMSHHGMVEHFDGQGVVFAPYLVEDYENVSNLLADAGMEYVFTGHFHAQDVAVKTTDSGNTIMDIMTGSSVSYPSPIRYVEIDKETGKIHIESERIKSIEGVPNFEEYSEKAMRDGVPGMVSSLLEGILVDLIDGVLPEDASPEMVATYNMAKEYMSDIIDANIDEIREAAEGNTDEKSDEIKDESKDNQEEIVDENQGLTRDVYIIPGILKKSQVVKYIKAVCEDLKTVEIDTTIGENYKFMDAIEHCLMEVYAGDENYSDAMKTLYNELKNTPAVQDALIKVLDDNKGEIGLLGKIPVVDLDGDGKKDIIISRVLFDKLFNMEISEGTTVGGLIGGAFADLLDGILSDDTPDNNAAYIAGNIVDFELSKLIVESSKIEKGNYTTASYNKLQEQIAAAKEIITNLDASKEEISSALTSLTKSVEGLVENSTGGGGGGGSVTPDSGNNTVSNTQLIGTDRYQTAVEISKEGWNSADTVFIVSGEDKNLVDGLTATPLATSKNAPILLAKNNSLPTNTANEIKRLNASKVIVIGGKSAISEDVISTIKGIKSNISVERIGGATRYETSLNIAKELDKTNDVSKVYIGAGDGEADSLSISPVAGREKAPILLTAKDGLDKDTLEFIKGEEVSDAYFIGGDAKISNSVINQVNEVTSKDVTNNRIAGETRQDTNAKIIEKFYTASSLNAVAVTKHDKLVDALSVGPLAAKKDMPVVLATDSLSTTQENILDNKKSSKLYEVGGGIKSAVIDKIKSLVK